MNNSANATNLTAALQAFCTKFNTDFTIESSRKVSGNKECYLFEVVIRHNDSDDPTLYLGSPFFQCNYLAWPTSKEASVTSRLTDHSHVLWDNHTTKNLIEEFSKIGAMIKNLHSDEFLTAALADSEASIEKITKRTQESKDSLNNANIMLSKNDATRIIQNMIDTTKVKAANKDRKSNPNPQTTKIIKVRFVDASGGIVQNSLVVKVKGRASIELKGQTVSKQDAIEHLTGAWISKEDYAEVADF